MSVRPARDNPFEFSRAERVALLTAVAIGALGLLSGYWWPRVWPAAREAPPADLSAYAAAIDAWTARARAQADSIAEEKAARKARYAARQAEWAARRERYAQRDYARDRYGDRPWRNTSPSARGDRSPRRAEPLAIDYTVPEPARGSLDPNVVDSLALARLGVPPAMIRRWGNYLDKGGRFRKTEDIARLYGMSDTMAARLVPYFRAEPVLAEARPNATTDTTAAVSEAAPRPRPRKRDAVVEVNGATEAELQTVRGIGPFFAARIVEYRERLGGFVDLEQMNETPGLRDSTIYKVAPQLRVDASALRPYYINRVADVQQARHPYVDYRAAKVILNYREQHGPYRSAADVARSQALPAEKLRRLAPYLDFGL